MEVCLTKMMPNESVDARAWFMKNLMIKKINLSQLCCNFCVTRFVSCSIVWRFSNADFAISLSLSYDSLYIFICSPWPAPDLRLLVDCPLWVSKLVENVYLRGWRPLKGQTRATCGCMAAGKVCERWYGPRPRLNSFLICDAERRWGGICSMRRYGSAGPSLFFLLNGY